MPYIKLLNPKMSSCMCIIGDKNVTLTCKRVNINTNKGKTAREISCGILYAFKYTSVGINSFQRQRFFCFVFLPQQ